MSVELVDRLEHAIRDLAGDRTTVPPNDAPTMRLHVELDQALDELRKHFHGTKTVADTVEGKPAAPAKTKRIRASAHPR